ncbi:IS3 family transposase, partial [Legionella pneumophila serogroup 10]
LNQHGLVGSMSKKGDCWDNSVAESFFSRLKDELVHWRNYQTRREAKQDILDYMTMFYNNQRLHSSLDYLSPNQFENRYWGLMKKVA